VLGWAVGAGGARDDQMPRAGDYTLINHLARLSVATPRALFQLAHCFIIGQDCNYKKRPACSMRFGPPTSGRKAASLVCFACSCSSLLSYSFGKTIVASCSACCAVRPRHGRPVLTACRSYGSGAYGGSSTSWTRGSSVAPLPRPLLTMAWPGHELADVRSFLVCLCRGDSLPIGIRPGTGGGAVLQRPGGFRLGVLASCRAGAVCGAGQRARQARRAETPNARACSTAAVLISGRPASRLSSAKIARA